MDEVITRESEIEAQLKKSLAGAEAFYGVKLDEDQETALAIYIAATWDRSSFIAHANQESKAASKLVDEALQADPMVEKANAALKAAVDDAMKRIRTASGEVTETLEEYMNRVNDKMKEGLENLTAIKAEAYNDWILVAPPTPQEYQNIPHEEV